MKRARVTRARKVSFLRKYNPFKIADSTFAAMADKDVNRLVSLVRKSGGPKP